MPYGLPHDASANGHRVDAVFGYLTFSTALCFAVMATILIVAVVFHRQGSHRPVRYTHGNRWRDRAVAAGVGLVVLVGIDLVTVVRSAGPLRAGFWSYPDGDSNALRIEVLAQQWAWNFRYPGADGQFDTADDVVTLNDLRVPVNRPVYLQLTSKDVVHSFYLPNFRTKVDAIPGTVTRLWFQAREPGVFEIACAQHCGTWHYRMRGELTALSARDFDIWMRRAAEDARLRFDAADRDAHNGWAWMPAR
jgi:cytochrome c oxidase subunit II